MEASKIVQNRTKLNKVEEEESNEERKIEMFYSFILRIENKKRFSVESAMINTYTFFESHSGANFLLLTDYINEYISGYWVHSCPVNWMRSMILWL
jgi:hypothetical protein